MGRGKQPDPTDDEPLGALIRRLREEAGLSLRELAGRMGVGAASLSAVEHGRRPRLSTLRLLGEHLPGATPRLLLDPDCTRPEPCSEAVWDWLALRFGFHARRVTLSLGMAGWELTVDGLEGASPSEPALWLAQACAACAGRSDLVWGLEVDSLLGNHEEEDRTHHYSRSASGAGLDYRCLGQDSHEGSYLVSFPVRELVLGYRGALEPQESVRVELLPQGQPSEPGGDLSTWVHPEGCRVEVGSDGCYSARIDHPLVGSRYRLGPSEATAGSALHGAGAVGTRVRRAREAAGFSLRELAREAKLSHPAIISLERGGDPRVDTLQALLSALPSLSPQDFLPLGRESVASGEDYWQHVKRFFGMEAAEVVKVLEIAPDGTRISEIHTRGLQGLRGDMDAIQIRVGLRRATLQTWPRVLRWIEAADHDVTMQRIERSDALDVHLFRFRPSHEREIFSYTRTYEIGGRCNLTTDQARADSTRPPPYRAGAALPITFPLRSCRLVVVFPAGYEPLDVKAHEWAAGFPADEPLMAESSLPRHLVRKARRGERRALHLTICRPTIGMKYGISWELP